MLQGRGKILKILGKQFPEHPVPDSGGKNEVEGEGEDDSPQFRRSRTSFETEQLDLLEKEFEKTHYPGKASRV